MRISDWSSDVCSSDHSLPHHNQLYVLWTALHLLEGNRRVLISVAQSPELLMKRYAEAFTLPGWQAVQPFALPTDADDLARFEETRAACIDFCGPRSEEHTSELQSLMRISYAVFCLKKKKHNKYTNYKDNIQTTNINH